MTGIRRLWISDLRLPSSSNPQVCRLLGPQQRINLLQGLNLLDRTVGSLKHTHTVMSADKIRDTLRKEGLLDFRYLFVETPDFQPPPNLANILEFAETDLRQGLGVMVHCLAGIGRTGTVLAAWMLKQNHQLTAMEAVLYVRERYIPDYARSRFSEHPSQFDALEQFARARGVN